MSSSFPFIASSYNVIRMYHNLFIHLPSERQLFPGLAVVKKSCYKIFIQDFVKTWSRITGLNGKYTFNFVRNSQTIFQRGCTSLHSPQQNTRVPTHSHRLQCSVLPVFFILGILLVR